MRALTMGAPLAVAAALVLGGCTPAPAAHHTAARSAALHGDFSGSGPGTLVAAEELRGTALRAVGAHGAFVPGGAADVHVQFEGSVGCADELRALVFAWQRAARRAGQDS